jgi:hypothetical protein
MLLSVRVSVTGAEIGALLPGPVAGDRAYRQPSRPGREVPDDHCRGAGHYRILCLVVRRGDQYEWLWSPRPNATSISSSGYGPSAVLGPLYRRALWGTLPADPAYASSLVDRLLSPACHNGANP